MSIYGGRKNYSNYFAPHVMNLLPQSIVLTDLDDIIEWANNLAAMYTSTMNAKQNSML